MKNILVGFLAVYLNIVWVNAAFCQQTVQTIQLSINGSTLDKNQVSLSFNQSTGLLTDPEFVMGELDQHQLFSADSSESAIADASASAGDGHLSVKVDAQAATGAGPPAFGGANATAGARAIATYQDNLHFDHVGAPGNVFYVFGLWNLSGTLSSSATLGGVKEGSPYVVNGAGSAALNVYGGGLSDFYVLNPRIALDQTSIENSGDPTQVRTDPTTHFITDYSGVSGSPVPVSFTLDATAGGYIGSADIASNNGGLVDGKLDFSHTAAWGGITSVTDADGNPITGWTVTSDSGFDYTHPYVAPEPSTFVLLGMAVPGLLLASRRRRLKISQSQLVAYRCHCN